MYDALHATRTTLPPLHIVQRIVMACALEAVDEWTDAWPAIKIREVDLMRNHGPIGWRHPAPASGTQASTAHRGAEVGSGPQLLVGIGEGCGGEGGDGAVVGEVVQVAGGDGG